jgi:hypothetical protein
MDSIALERSSLRGIDLARKTKLSFPGNCKRRQTGGLPEGNPTMIRALLKTVSQGKLLTRSMDRATSLIFR